MAQCKSKTKIVESVESALSRKGLIELAAGRLQGWEEGGLGQNTVSLNFCQNGKQYNPSDDDDDIYYL